MQYFFTLRNDLDCDSVKLCNPKEISLKPNGVIWATKYNFEYKDYNEWIDYLTSNTHILFFKNNIDLYNRKCFIFAFKEEAKILVINDSITLNNLINKYNYNNNSIDFIALSKDYDGYYIDVINLLDDKNINCNLKEMIKKYAINSLVLFNTNCIAYYYDAILKIAPFDYEYFSSADIYYTIDSDNEKKFIGKSKSL